MTGKVKFYLVESNYGFIKAEDGRDIFVHCSGLADSSVRLRENDTVSFEIGTRKNKPIAEKVTVVAPRAGA